jgi:hypothetical protein
VERRFEGLEERLAHRTVAHHGGGRQSGGDAREVDRFVAAIVILGVSQPSPLTEISS